MVAMSRASLFGRLAAGLSLAMLLGLPAVAQAPNPVTPAAKTSAKLATAPVQKTFVRESLASDAVRLETALKSEAPAGAKNAAQWRREAEAAEAAEEPVAGAALKAHAASVSADPSDTRNWLGYARAASEAGNDEDSDDYSGKTKLRARALAAAYQAYLKAKNPTDEASALSFLGEAYVAQSEWRPALEAYRASLGIKDEAETRATYEKLREEHGFRILDYKVDSDAAAPRVCFTFSETLPRKTDFTPYVAVSGAANAAVTAEGSQVCVDGLKHSERYAFVIREGLPSTVGETLLKSADYELYVRDRSPQVRFSGRNYVLPRTGQAGVPIISVNAPKVDVEIVRVGDRGLLPALQSEDFLSQLSGSTAKEIASEKGVSVWKGSLDTAKAEVNRDAVTAFPVLQAVGKLEPGLYIMVANPSGTLSADEDEEGSYEAQATQWFVVSDLGLTAFKGKDGVHVFARSLASAKAVGNAEIRLIAKNNDVLATAKTDAKGHAGFAAGLGRGEGGLAPGLVVAQLGDDYGFIDLSQSAFDLSDRGVAGRPAPGTMDAYVFPERGVYRSGETVQLTALLRDATGTAVPNLPLTLVVKRPDGVEYRRVALPDGGLGGRALALPLMAGAAHGTWRVSAYTDPKGSPIGEASWLVEDYVPERLEVSLTPKRPALKQGEPATIDVAARYLYGAPGSGLEVSGSVAVQAAKTSGISGLDGFSIGLDDEEVEATTAEVETKFTTDAQGRTEVVMPVQEVVAARPLEAKITLQVGEPGGRALSRSLTLPILPKSPVLAIRKNFSGNLQEGGTASFDVVMVTPEGQRLAQNGVGWTLSKIDRTYQWYREDGTWSYEAVKSTRRVADGRIDVTADTPARITTPVTFGKYRLDATLAGQPAAAASVEFTVGWDGGETADAPDLLDLSLDKGAYASGERLRAKITPKFAGTATLAVVGDKLSEIVDVSVPEGGTTVEIPVKAEWGSGAYLVASAYRPLDQAAKRMPGRALGLAWFSVDKDKRVLNVSVAAPAKTRPRETLTVPVKIAGLQSGEEARVTVAAVDVGILNLTRYQSPNPFSYFFGQKALGTEIRDLYGFLIDGMQGTLGAIRSGGDEGGGEFADTPPTQEPLALYSGIVTIGADGTAQVPLALPAFNGTARVMVTAWTKSRVGQAQADVIVRDPVVLTGTLPRFLNVGDRSRFFVALDNVEGPAGEYTVDLDLAGPVLVGGEAVRSTVKLAAGAKSQLVIPITAAGPGTARLDVNLSGAGIEGNVGQSFALAIGPGTGPLVRRTVRPLEPGASAEITKELLADILPGTGTVSVSASRFAGLDVPALLAALDRYPYGCSEQTVSKAMPLLYVSKLGNGEKLGLDDKLDERIRGAIERVLARQDSSGSFGAWSANEGSDTWLDSYVTDFLTRARERGFAVPQQAMTMALDQLRNTVANATNVENGGMDLAYAAYVLARNGRPVMGDLRYLTDTKLSDFSTPLARGQLAAALALLGDRGRAQKTFDTAVKALQDGPDKGDYRADYGSRLRDGAGLIALAAETGMTRQSLPVLAGIVTKERESGRLTSTQENAWMVLAAAGLSNDTESLAIGIDGVVEKGPLARSFKAPALDDKSVRITNAGSEPVQLVVGVSGNPIGPEPAESRGYTLERGYYRLDGSSVDASKPLRQNDRLVVVLKVTEAKASAGRLLLVDRLPAGLEIDNPKLLDSDALSGLAWAKTEVTPAHTEFRDDRFIAAYDRDPEQSAFFFAAYTVRVVSPGTYVHPGALIEDMYRPDRFGRTAFGSVEVVSAK